MNFCLYKKQPLPPKQKNWGSQLMDANFTSKITNPCYALMYDAKIFRIKMHMRGKKLRWRPARYCGGWSWRLKFFMLFSLSSMVGKDAHPVVRYSKSGVVTGKKSGRRKPFDFRRKNPNLDGGIPGFSAGFSWVTFLKERDRV